MLEGKKTYIGLIVAAAPVIGNFFGYDVDPVQVEGLVIEVEAVVSAIGIAFATFGRAVTKKDVVTTS